MSRLVGFAPNLAAAVAILIAMAGCSSSPPDSKGKGGTGGASIGGTTGAGGTTGTAGVSGTTGAAGFSGTIGSAGVSGTTGSAGVSGTTGSAGVSGTTGSAGVSGTAGTAGVGGPTGSAGVSGTAGSTGAGGGAGSGTACFGKDIDLRATTVSGTFTVNGAVVTDPTTKGAGIILLRNGDDSALLGTSAAAGGAYSALVFPGTYDLYYAVSTIGTGVPNNARTKLRSGVVVGSSPLKLDVDVPATKVSGAVTVNGGTVRTMPDIGEGTVSLVNAAGDSVFLANATPTGSYSAVVVPGTYDLTYSGTTAGSLLPTNTSAKIQSGIVVGTAPLSLNVDVPTPTVSATITINGAAVTGASKGQWSLTLKDAAGAGAPLATYSASTGAYSAHVFPGTYDLYWTGNGTGTDIPANKSAKIQTGIVVGTSAVSLNVDVPATAVSGSVTLAGASSGLPATGGPYLNLRSAAGDTAPLNVTTTGTYSARVVPGTYDVYFGVPSAPLNATYPRNASAKIKSGVVVGASPVSLNVDVPVTTVSGTATLNGAAITTTAQSSFILNLQNAAGDRVQIANHPQGGVFSVPLVPGTYDLYYTRQGDIGLDVPNNVLTKIRSGIVVGTSPTALDVDIRSTTLSGAVTVNGLANAAVSGDAVFLALSDGVSNIADSGAQLAPVTSTTGGTYQNRVLAGRYELYYFVYRVVGKGLPVNVNAHLGCFDIP